MKKRNLFSEIAEGFDAMAEARPGKRTLRTHEVEMMPAQEKRSVRSRPGRPRCCSVSSPITRTR